jgi:hypothetical protein
LFEQLLLLIASIAYDILGFPSTQQFFIYVYWLRHFAADRRVAGSIPDEVNFKINLILKAAFGTGVYSASNRNEYQKHKNNNVSGE